MKETNFNFEEFSSYLNSKEEVFVIDLSKSTLLECIQELINFKSKLSINYGKNYSSLINNLKIIEEKSKCKLMPHQITDIFWCNFIPFCLSRGLSLSSIKTMCSQLKTVIQWAGKHKATISDSYELVKIPPYCHEQIALTPDEVSHIYHFNIKTIKRRKQYLETLEKVKDMFVLSCNLGQRFSDMVRIDKSCFNRNIFTILQQKTSTLVKVDIDKMSLDKTTTYSILEKYSYKTPLNNKDNTAYDRYLKQLLQYIGEEFSKEIKRDTKINGVIETKYYPKWKLISSHTARRTFITNNVIKGINTIDVMKASGHKSFSSFEKYLCYFND